MSQVSAPRTSQHRYLIKYHIVTFRLYTRRECFMSPANCYLLANGYSYGREYLAGGTGRLIGIRGSGVVSYFIVQITGI